MSSQVATFLHEQTLWRSRHAEGGDEGTKSRRIGWERKDKLGLSETHALSLVHLLAHYPWIVYLGFSFWRKLLYRVDKCAIEWSATFASPFLLRSNSKNKGRPSGPEMSALVGEVGPALLLTILPSDLQVPLQDGTDRLRICRALFWNTVKGRAQMVEFGILLTSLIVNSQVDAFELMRLGGGSRGWELDVNCTWYNETTLLLTAATTGQVLIGQRLLCPPTPSFNPPPSRSRAAGGGGTSQKWVESNERNVADVNRRELEEGRYPIHAAAMRGHTDFIDLIMTHPGGNADVADEYGDTPLMEAAYNGHLDVITQLVRKYKIDVNKRGGYGGTVIHTAMNARVPSLALIKLLVDDFGADIRVPGGTHRKTPLELAEANTKTWKQNEEHADIATFLRAKLRTTVMKKHHTASS